MRNAGSLPQLASPSATSMLLKRSSNSGGKDHGLVRCVVFSKCHENRWHYPFVFVEAFSALKLLTGSGD